jgi:hypothetical protein
MNRITLPALLLLHAMICVYVCGWSGRLSYSTAKPIRDSSRPKVRVVELRMAGTEEDLRARISQRNEDQSRLNPSSLRAFAEVDAATLLELKKVRAYIGIVR